MRFWVGITDGQWYEYLAARKPEEVNFWQPSARRRAAALEAGVPFLFKLHSPANFIVGGAFFVRYSALPARVAWEAFGENNGVPDYGALRRRVEQYRKGPVSGDPGMADERSRPPYHQPSPIPAAYAWPALLAKDGDALFEYCRHMLEELGKQPRTLALIFGKAQRKVTLRRAGWRQ